MVHQLKLPWLRQQPPEPGEAPPEPDAEASTESAAPAAPAAPAVDPENPPSAPADRQSLSDAKAYLEADLERLAPGKVASLVLTNNRVSLLSARRRPEGLALRVHRCFATGGEEIIAALLVAAIGDRRRAETRRAVSTLREFAAARLLEKVEKVEKVGQVGQVGQVERAGRVESGRSLTKDRPISAPRPGTHHCLERLAARVRQTYFSTASELDKIEVVWGRFAALPKRRRRARFGGQGGQRHRRRRRSLRLGSFDARQDLVRIHPVLDHHEVPEFVVESIIHHELLHTLIPPQTTPSGRRRIHPPEFQRREQEFEQTSQVEEWMEAHLDSLFRRRSQRSQK